jgi:hypothetical protein
MTRLARHARASWASPRLPRTSHRAPRTSLRHAVALLALAAGSACGGSVGFSQNLDEDAGGGGGAGWGGSAGADAAKPKDAGKDRDGDAPATLDTEKPKKDAFDEYNDPGCPDAPGPIIDNQCDPLSPWNGCPPGEACYPYVVYPSPGDPCDVERYGATCEPAGTLGQEKYCMGTNQCAPGFVCVVSGSGNKCVKLCSPGKLGSCPDGLVCEPLDVPGYGGCL